MLKLKIGIQVDDRTGGFRITGGSLTELKTRKPASNSKSPLELLLWTHQHSAKDLEEISYYITEHPGLAPVILHFQNSAGKRVSAKASETFSVERSPALLTALERFIE